MVALARVVEILLGLFFIVSAGLKAMDVEAFATAISAYGVVRDPALVTVAAYCTLAIETAIGACFLGRWRLKGWTYGAATALTVVFTGLIAYAWQYKGLEDCGCFGKAISMGPGASIVKNLVLLAVLGVAWYVLRDKPIPQPADQRFVPRIVSAVASVFVVFGLTTYSVISAESEPYRATAVKAEKDRPFQTFQFDYEGKSYNLGEGEYLVAFLSATCTHCQASVEYLNEYPMDPRLPELVALMMADSSQELEDFELLTQPHFPTQPIDTLVFMKFLGELSHPPRLSYIRDGRELQHWAWAEGEEPPSPDQLAESIGQVGP